MKVSTRVEYGMLALTDIALYSDNGSSVSAPEIAERQKISQKYLEQILTHLKQAGLIRAQKGLRGGYALTRTADKISIAEVLNALDSDILDEMSNTGNEAERNLRNAVNVCLWEEMNRLLIEFAERKTLSDFMQECRNQMSGEWDLYII
ncbi:MAG: Rrf2 family transcriptional regulator [Oscillospiraceae bacterium]|nr:Rrf2 family transcriptional regulator [Oscillospiraceae bacterium]